MNTLPDTMVATKAERSRLKEAIRTQVMDEFTDRIGMLRQWINEDRIINNPKQKLVTNDEIMYWLTGDEGYLKDRHDFVVDRLIEYNKKHGYGTVEPYM